MKKFLLAVPKLGLSALSPKWALSLLLLVSSGFSQSWDDIAAYKQVNFDKLLSGTDKMIFVQPPEGKYWVIIEGSFNLERPVPGATVVIWTESAPYAPYRDPVTGEMNGCDRCVPIIRGNAAERTMFPIVGGFAEENGHTIRGQVLPVIITYPNRLAVAVTPEHGGLSDPVQTYLRFTILERAIPADMPAR